MNYGPKLRKMHAQCQIDVLIPISNETNTVIPPGQAQVNWVSFLV